MGQVLFLTDPGKRVSSGLISPGRVWDCVAWSGKGGSWQSNGWDSSLSLGFNPGRGTKTPHDVWGEGGWCAKRKRKKGRGYLEFQQNRCGEGSSQEAISQTQRVRRFLDLQVTFNIAERQRAVEGTGRGDAQTLGCDRLEGNTNASQGSERQDCCWLVGKRRLRPPS